MVISIYHRLRLLLVQPRVSGKNVRQVKTVKRSKETPHVVCWRYFIGENEKSSGKLSNYSVFRSCVPIEETILFIRTTRHVSVNVAVVFKPKLG